MNFKWFAIMQQILFNFLSIRLRLLLFYFFFKDTIKKDHVTSFLYIVVLTYFVVLTALYSWWTKDKNVWPNKIFPNSHHIEELGNRNFNFLSLSLLKWQIVSYDNYQKLELQMIFDVNFLLRITVINPVLSDFSSFGNSKHSIFSYFVTQFQLWQTATENSGIVFNA